MKDTKNIIDDNGNLKDTSEFQRSESVRASLEKLDISSEWKEKLGDDFVREFERYGISICEDEDSFKFESPEPSIILSYVIKQKNESFAKGYKDGYEMGSRVYKDVCAEARDKAFLEILNKLEEYLPNAWHSEQTGVEKAIRLISKLR